MGQFEGAVLLGPRETLGLPQVEEEEAAASLQAVVVGEVYGHQVVGVVEVEVYHQVVVEVGVVEVCRHLVVEGVVVSVCLQEGVVAAVEVCVLGVVVGEG